MCLSRHRLGYENFHALNATFGSYARAFVCSRSSPIPPRPFVLLTASGKYVKSTELVPGDIYEVTDPRLEQFPADSLLLSGDCIVNESMLTGTVFCKLPLR